MKLESVRIKNYRAITQLSLPLDQRLSVFFGDNAHGKTSVLSAIAVGLGSILKLLPNVNSEGFLDSDRRGDDRRGDNLVDVEIELTATGGARWFRNYDHRGGIFEGLTDIEGVVNQLLERGRRVKENVELPILAFYDTDRSIYEVPFRKRALTVINPGRASALEGALSSKTNFEEFLRWFYTRENEELRFQREFGTFSRRLNDLDAVRRAIESMIPGVSAPRVRGRTVRISGHVGFRHG